MAKDLGDAIGTAIGRAAREAASNVASNARKSTKGANMDGAKGLAVGAGLAALAPLVVKGAGKLGKGAKDTVGKGVKAGVEKTADKAGGAGGIAAKAGKNMIPGLGGGGDDDGDGGGKGGKKNDVPGVGKGRRMPIQQAVDVAVPIKTAYNQWTQFEEWPQFMHRLQSVSQEDETHVKFKTKIWGISKEFTAEITEQRPDERIKWKVTEGVTHTGVVTFHELADRLTRIEVNIDVQPGSLIEKAGRGMRHVKRAIRADLARFKAYVTMEEEESGSWRGRIEDGDVKKQRTSSSSRSRGSSSKSRSSGSRSGSSGSRSGSSSSRGSKSSASSSRGRSASSRSRSSNGSGSSSGGRSRTTAKSSSGSRSSSGSKSRSSSNGRSSNGSSSRSGSSRKKSGSRS